MNQPENPSSPKAPEHPEVVSLQNVCIIDHVCTVSAESLQSLIHDELGGSHRVSIQEIHSILATLGDFITKSGGAASNTLRSLAGFGVRTRLIGARGHDEWGPFFASSLKRCNVDVSRLISKPGQTGRCVILSCNGERTMRTCMDDAARLSIDDLDVKDFSGCRFFFLSGCTFEVVVHHVLVRLTQSHPFHITSSMQIACTQKDSQREQCNLPWKQDVKLSWI